MNKNHIEVEAEFKHLESITPGWNAATRRESVIGTLSMKWGMPNDEAAEIVDSYLRQSDRKMTDNGKTTSVFSRDGLTIGVSSNPSGFRCQQDGCLGRRLVVKWPDGMSTRPCTKGMFTRPDGNLQIG